MAWLCLPSYAPRQLAHIMPTYAYKTHTAIRTVAPAPACSFLSDSRHWNFFGAVHSCAAPASVVACGARPHAYAYAHACPLRSKPASFALCRHPPKGPRLLPARVAHHSALGDAEHAEQPAALRCLQCNAVQQASPVSSRRLIYTPPHLPVLPRYSAIHPCPAILPVWFLLPCRVRVLPGAHHACCSSSLPTPLPPLPSPPLLATPLVSS